MINRIITKEDILQEIADETGKDLKVIKEVINYNIKYLKNIVSTDEEVLAINLPNLGVLKVNYMFNLVMAKKNVVAKKRLELLRDKINAPTRFSYKRPLLYTINYKYGNKLDPSIKRYYQIMKLISLKSNEKNNEIYN